MKNKKIDYVFVYFNARKKRINEGKESPEEFFYGYQYIKNKGFEVAIVEFGGKVNPVINLLLNNFQKIFTKIFKFQYDFSGILYKESLKTIKLSKSLILTNTRIGHSLIPYIIYNKLFKKDTEFSVFAMGMFNSSSNNKIILRIHKYLHSTLLYFIDNLIFIGQKEYKYALEIFKNQKSKIKFLPFGIDNNFWNTKDEKKDGPILFIGNDSNRDFDFLEKLVNQLSNKKFIVVSEHTDGRFKNLENVETLKGSWNKNILDDESIKNLYSQSKLTIIPLKNSLQPSGQSVALQSMSMNTPVIITQTDGFWDVENFKHKENIYFIEKNKVSEWEIAIEELENDEKIYQKIQINAKSLIDQKFNTLEFGKNLFNIVGK